MIAYVKKILLNMLMYFYNRESVYIVIINFIYGSNVYAVIISKCKINNLRISL
jgi:hypothetical protein